MENTSLIVVGELITDLVTTGLKEIPKAGQLVNGTSFSISPGGKSRNIAAMAGSLMPQGNVAMVSRTVSDNFGLWEIPFEALKASGVNTQFIKVLKAEETEEMPGIAMIAVDVKGNNQVIGAPGISRSLGIAEVDAAKSLFETVGHNKGFLAFIGNCPEKVAKYSLEKSRNLGIKVLFDPGGADDLTRLETFMKGVYLFKPNEHEASLMTGIEITDLLSASKAALKLREMGAQNVLITAGSEGGFLFTQSTTLHIPAPKVKSGAYRDETGCGDQVMAALCASLQSGATIEKAAQIAILAGTLQFYRRGIEPITAQELSSLI